MATLRKDYEKFLSQINLAGKSIAVYGSVHSNLRTYLADLMGTSNGSIIFNPAYPPTGLHYALVLEGKINRIQLDALRTALVANGIIFFFTPPSNMKALVDAEFKEISTKTLHAWNKKIKI